MTPVNVQTNVCLQPLPACMAISPNQSLRLGKSLLQHQVWWNQYRSLSLESAKAESAQRRQLNSGVSIARWGQDVMGRT